MDSCGSWPENLPSGTRRVIEELVKGREFSLLLQNIIQESSRNNASEVSINPDLVVNILNSFTTSLSILKNGDSDEVSQVPANAQLSSWNGGYRKLEDSGESSKSSKIKDRRGCYKRRKFAETKIQYSSSLVDDGHAWRKYGQKVILHAKYPRQYFRCTHKHDQGCQATKQVQRIEEEPPLFRTTYCGHHTCKNLLKASQNILLDSTSDQCPMINFGSTHITDKDHYSPFFSSFQSIKRESKDHHHQVPSDVTYNNNQSSSSDFLLSSEELTAFESTGHMSTAVLSSDHGDVISGVNSSSCTAIGAGINVESVDFGDVLQFVQF